MLSKASGSSSGFIAVQPSSPVTGIGLELSLPNGLILSNIQADNVSLVSPLLGQLS